MVFYEFLRPNQELIKQNEVIFTFDGIIFYNVEDTTNIGEFYSPLGKDFTNEDFNFADRIFKGTIEKYNDKGDKEKIEMTDEQKAKALEVYKEVKIIKLKKYNQDLLKNAFNVLSIEKESWERQKTEADLYTNDNTAEVPFITTLAQARGIELETLVSKILEKATQYSNFVASTLGTQHKLEELIENAETVKEILEIELPDFCRFYFDI